MECLEEEKRGQRKGLNTVKENEKDSKDSRGREQRSIENRERRDWSKE